MPEDMDARLRQYEKKLDWLRREAIFSAEFSTDEGSRDRKKGIAEGLTEAGREFYRVFPERRYLELTKAQLSYLRERGFEIVEGLPLAEAQYPFVTLAERITYHSGSGSGASYSNKEHPSNPETDADELVFLIEKMVASDMRLEGLAFRTKLGEPIKVFVSDPEWNEVARKLKQRYEKQ